MSSESVGPVVPAPSARLTEAERAKMLAGVEKLIHKRVIAFDIPRDDRDDAAAECQLRLWELSEEFDPTGKAKWSTFAQTVCDRVLLDFRDRSNRETRRGGVPTVSLDSLRVSGGRAFEIAANDEETQGDDETGGDDERTNALALAVRKMLASSALEALSPGYRRLVEQVVIGRLSVAQIAEQTGQPEKVIRVNLQAALGQLAKAGHVPAGPAAALGFDARRLAERATPGARAKNVTARRQLVAEALALGMDAKAIAAELGEPVGNIARDVKAVRAEQPSAPAVAV
jgi:RNA polymerase sigma factor (sigma-70 family)